MVGWSSGTNDNKNAILVVVGAIRYKLTASDVRTSIESRRADGLAF
jgi:hypothetical protein